MRCYPLKTQANRRRGGTRTAARARLLQTAIPDSCAAATVLGTAWGGPNAPRLINTNLPLCGFGSKFRKYRVFYCTSGGKKLPRRFLLLLYFTNFLMACDHNDTNFQKTDTRHKKVSLVCTTLSSYRLGLTEVLKASAKTPPPPAAAPPPPQMLLQQQQQHQQHGGHHILAFERTTLSTASTNYFILQPCRWQPVPRRQQLKTQPSSSSSRAASGTFRNSELQDVQLRASRPNPAVFCWIV